MNDKFYAKGDDPSNKSVGWLAFKKRFFRDFWGIQLRFICPIFTPLILTPIAHTPEVMKVMWMKSIPYYGAYWYIKDLYKDRPLNAFEYIVPILQEAIYTFVAYQGLSNYWEYAGVLRRLALRMADVQTFIKIAHQIKHYCYC